MLHEEEAMFGPFEVTEIPMPTVDGGVELEHGDQLPLVVSEGEGPHGVYEVSVGDWKRDKNDELLEKRAIVARVELVLEGLEKRVAELAGRVDGCADVAHEELENVMMLLRGALVLL